VAFIAASTTWLVIDPVYQSAGMIRVLPRESKILYADSDDSRLRLYDAFVAAEVEVLQSRPVLEAALAELQAPSEAPTMIPGDVGDLAAMLGIVAKKGLISVAARSPDPLLSAAAVNAVLTAYEAGNEAARRRHYDVRHDELSARAEELQKSLTVLNNQYLRIGGEHDAGTLSKAHIAKTAQLEVLEERISELENTLSQLQSTGGAGADVGSIEIQRATLLDQATADMTYERAQRLAALETLRSRYRPSHPKLRAAESELVVLEAAIAERREQIATLGKAGALTDGGAGQQSLADLDALKAKLLGRRETLRSEAAELNNKLFRIGEIQVEQTRLSRLLEETKRALDEVQVESQNDLSRSVEIIVRGKVPDGAIEDKRKPAALGAAVFGGLGCFACVILGTLAIGRIRFSDDLDPRGSRLLAAVAPVDEGGTQIHVAARRLRNEFDLRWPERINEPLVISVLTTNPGAGGSAFASAIGQTYAAARRRVLLIDADPGGNGLSRRCGIAGSLGMRAVSTGGLDLRSATSTIRTPAGEQLDLLAAPAPAEDAVPGSASPAELAIDDMRSLLEDARSAYDVIVLDLGVATAGRQSAVGAAVSDRIALVANCGTRRRWLDAALTLLERIAPDRTLLFLNNAQAHDPALAATHAAHDPVRLATRLDAWLEDQRWNPIRRS
jgi:uncharacterized protein involved in exopolysaccharide biosynthesis